VTADGVRPVVLEGGRIIDPSQSLDTVGDVVLIGGRITHVGRDAGRPDGAAARPPPRGPPQPSPNGATDNSPGRKPWELMMRHEKP